jgi:hypothetical protein
LRRFFLVLEMEKELASLKLTVLVMASLKELA